MVRLTSIVGPGGKPPERILREYGLTRQQYEAMRAAEKLPKKPKPGAEMVFARNPRTGRIEAMRRSDAILRGYQVVQKKEGRWVVTEDYRAISSQAREMKKEILASGPVKGGETGIYISYEPGKLKAEFEGPPREKYFLQVERGGKKVTIPVSKGVYQMVKSEQQKVGKAGQIKTVGQNQTKQEKPAIPPSLGEAYIRYGKGVASGFLGAAVEAGEAFILSPSLPSHPESLLFSGRTLLYNLTRTKNLTFSTALREIKKYSRDPMGYTKKVREEYARRKLKEYTELPQTIVESSRTDPFTTAGALTGSMLFGFAISKSISMKASSAPSRRITVGSVEMEEAVSGETSAFSGKIRIPGKRTEMSVRGVVRSAEGKGEINQFASFGVVKKTVTSRKSVLSKVLGQPVEKVREEVRPFVEFGITQKLKENTFVKSATTFVEKRLLGKSKRQVAKVSGEKTFAAAEEKGMFKFENLLVFGRKRTATGVGVSAARDLKVRAPKSFAFVYTKKLETVIPEESVPPVIRRVTRTGKPKTPKSRLEKSLDSIVGKIVEKELGTKRKKPEEVLGTVPSAAGLGEILEPEPRQIIKKSEDLTRAHFSRVGTIRKKLKKRTVTIEDILNAEILGRIPTSKKKVKGLPSQTGPVAEIVPSSFGEGMSMFGLKKLEKEQEKMSKSKLKRKAVVKLKKTSKTKTTSIKPPSPPKKTVKIKPKRPQPPGAEKTPKKSKRKRRRYGYVEKIHRIVTPEKLLKGLIGSKIRKRR